MFEGKDLVTIYIYDTCITLNFYYNLWGNLYICVYYITVQFVWRYLTQIATLILDWLKSITLPLAPATLVPSPVWFLNLSLFEHSVSACVYVFLYPLLCPTYPFPWFFNLSPLRHFVSAFVSPQTSTGALSISVDSHSSQTSVISRIVYFLCSIGIYDWYEKCNDRIFLSWMFFSYNPSLNTSDWMVAISVRLCQNLLRDKSGP
jgi:hypothetical protein